MSTKNDRQEAIIRLIKENSISTQDELTALMRKQGFKVTQATCSRDIKDLGIIKVTGPGQTTKYAVLDRTGDIAPGRLLAVFANSLLSCDCAMNIVVVRTLPGMAQAAAAALDSMRLHNVVGTIAGDDTIFIASQGIEEAKSLLLTIKDLMNSGSSEN